MGFEYVGMWAFHNIVATQMEGGRGDSNPTHPISNRLWIHGGIGLNVSI
jgi:hypothetical protein